MPASTSAKVTAVALSDESHLWDHVQHGDFLDCYATRTEISPRAAAQIIVTFPGWARALVVLRRILTAPFGLDNDGPPSPDKLGPFPVQLETDHEIIAGFDDRHLDFRVSILSRAGVVSLATWVHTHNLGGRLYLAAIMPFHILIARNALTRVARAAASSDAAGAV